MTDGDDDFVPLSRSCLWDLQRRYFDERGIRAWSEAVVPQYITSNPWIASAYAQVVAAWLRECGESIDPKAPVDVVELGCGSGRFGYLFLRRLHELVPSARVRYVFTDFTEYNLDVLRSHPSLQPFVAAGQADFALFDVERDRELRLTHGGEVISGSTARNPMVFIANYVFDGVRNDCFRFADGAIQQVLVRARRGEPGDGVMDGVTMACELRPVEGGHYDDPRWNRILETYSRTLRGDVAVLFPRSALTCLQALHELSGGRFLVLSGDKGYVHERALAASGEPQMASHGSFSMMVNYHAIEQWTAMSGGRSLHTSHLHSPLSVVALTFGAPHGAETEAAFRDWIDRRGPDDFLSLKHAFETGHASYTPEQLLAWLRFSGWDHGVFMRMVGELLRHAEGAPPLQREELRDAALQVWREYFPLREPVDVAFHAALLLMTAGSHEEALELFGESIRWFGPDGATSMNRALACCALQRWPDAIAFAREALELDPELESARELLVELEGL